MGNISEKTKLYIISRDDFLNKSAGWQTNDIKTYVNALFEFGRVEVGYRSSCGVTDRTHKVFKEWLKVLKKIRADGVKVREEIQKHGNGYATNNGGVWNSTIYILLAGFAASLPWDALKGSKITSIL